MVIYERDNKITNLKNSVFDQMSSILKEYEPKDIKIKDKNNTSFVGLEDAIKELITMGVDVNL